MAKVSLFLNREENATVFVRVKKKCGMLQTLGVYKLHC